MNRYLDVAPEVQEALESRQARCGAGEHHHLPRHALSPECGDRSERGEDHPRQRRRARHHRHHRRPAEGRI